MNQDNLFKGYEEVSGNKEEDSYKKKKGFEYAYSPFALQDAIGERNVKKIWIEYEKLRLAGIEAENIIYKIIGKVRDIAAMKMGAGKGELSLSDYPYFKSKKDLNNWKEKELKDLYTKLISVYHQSRMGGDELDIATEKTLLGI